MPKKVRNKRGITICKKLCGLTLNFITRNPKSYVVLNYYCPSVSDNINSLGD